MHIARCFVPALLAAAVLLVSGCSRREAVEVPPRADDAIEMPSESSVLAAPIEADIGPLLRQIEREIPRRLWSINRSGATCVPSQKVEVAFVRVKTPKVKCDITGTVTRGRLTISAEGQRIVVTMPIHATVRAKDIGGILKQETATGNARVRAVARIEPTADWRLRGDVDIRYDWTDAPHIEFLGQRIEFADKADRELVGVVRRLEHSLEREIAAIRLRGDVERVWRDAFTVLKLNDANPPVWMRVTPEQPQYGGYALSGNTLKLDLGLRARTETFVGERPTDPDPIPLPPLAPLEQRAGQVAFFIPVVADYAELQPVIERALTKRARRPFPVPKFGAVDASFANIRAYGTVGGRVAVGADVTAQRSDGRLAASRGTIWLTAMPVNEENSRSVSFTDIEIVGDTDRVSTDLLLKLARSPAYSDTIAEALGQNFERDYRELLGKVERAIAMQRRGDVLVRAQLGTVRTGTLRAAGQGLYLPVRGDGTVSISLDTR